MSLFAHWLTILLLVKATCISLRLKSPLGDPYYVFGIGPTCYHKPINQSTEMNLRARFHDKAVDYIFYKRDITNPWLNSRLFQYKHFDICDGGDVLLKLLVDLLLNPEYTITTDPCVKTGRRIYAWKYKSKILIVFAYMEDRNFKLLAEILSDTDILILNLRSDVRFHQNENVLPSLTIGAIDKVKTSFQELLGVMNWKYLTLIYLRNSISNSEEYFRHYKNMLFERSSCLDIEESNSYDFDHTLNKLRDRNQSSHAVILLGSQLAQASFIQSYGPSNKTWFINENYRPIKNKGGTIIAFRDQRYQALGATKFHTVDQLASLFYFSKQPGYTKTLYSMDYTVKLYEDINFFMVLYKERIKKYPINLLTLKWFIRQNLYYRRVQIYVNSIEITADNSSVLKVMLQPYMKHNTCPEINCAPGFEYVYTKLDINTTTWNESYRWTCQPCTNGFYKPTRGNSTCLSCPSMYLSNERRDSCYDPYTFRVISTNQPFAVLAIVLSILGLSSCSVVFIAFMKFRSTPVMKAAGLEITFTHLFVMVLNFGLLIYAFYGTPTILKCYCRLFSLTMFYTVSVALVLLRSQRVLKAFGSHVKMTKSEVRKSKMVEFFSVLILIIAQNLILLVVVYQKPIAVKTIINIKTFEKTPFCEIETHLNIVIGMTICLQFVCFVQAFCGRRLPGAFKETMSIVYGSFIVILIFIVSYPIVSFQKDVLQRDIFYWISITLSMNVLVVFCYFRRVYIAVFCPEQNTVEYSRAIIMAKMSKQSRITLLR
ncbi:uncharacterized protein [Clytia hemisphaerica]|uniref:uncharacterized protein n=1 Tax=Clytia hemisphaerica TaxID=252671 RepID=UPI0034D477C9